MKAFTDLEQSKKLAEILPHNTADGTWKRVAITGINLDVPEGQQYFHDGDTPFVFYNGIGIPSWSLAALIGLMPTDDKKDEYYVDTESHSNYHTVSYRNCWDGCIHSEYSEESLLDAAFEMVCWLKENKKI